MADEPKPRRAIVWAEIKRALFGFLNLTVYSDINNPYYKKNDPKK